MISSSVWSTLMTSSIRRWMSLAKTLLMDALVVIEPGPRKSGTSEDLRPVVVLGVKHAHEAEARGAIEFARVEQYRRDVHAALQLFKERERPVHGKQGAG